MLASCEISSFLLRNPLDFTNNTGNLPDKGIFWPSNINHRLLLFVGLVLNKINICISYNTRLYITNIVKIATHNIKLLRVPYVTHD